MAHSRRLFENLPLYAQMFDEDVGILKHLCDNAIQAELESIYRILEERPYFYDHEHPLAARHLDWLGQFYGLGITESHYLGIGINPNWTFEEKRNLIRNAIAYWQIKATEDGVRSAIALWLQHNEISPQQLPIIYPFGSGQIQPVHKNLWWHYTTPFRSQDLNSFVESKRLGSGDYFPGKRYIPSKFTLLTRIPGQDEAIVDADLTTRIKYAFTEKVPPTQHSRSQMGKRSPHQHFFYDKQITAISASDWNRIVPQVKTLNYETWDAMTTPAIFAWINHAIADTLTLKKADLPYGHDPNQKYPLQVPIYLCRNWLLIVTTTQHSYGIHPYKIFFTNSNNQRQLHYTTEYSKIVLNFTLKPITSLETEAITKIELLYQSICYEQLNLGSLQINQDINLGFIFTADITLVSGGIERCQDRFSFNDCDYGSVLIEGLVIKDFFGGTDCDYGNINDKDVINDRISLVDIDTGLVQDQEIVIVRMVEAGPNLKRTCASGDLYVTEASTNSSNIVWTQISGSPITILNETTINPIFVVGTNYIYTEPVIIKLQDLDYPEVYDTMEVVTGIRDAIPPGSNETTDISYLFSQQVADYIKGGVFVNNPLESSPTGFITISSGTTPSFSWNAPTAYLSQISYFRVYKVVNGLDTLITEITYNTVSSIGGFVVGETGATYRIDTIYQHGTIAPGIPFVLSADSLSHAIAGVDRQPCHSSSASITASVEIPFFDFLGTTIYNANDSAASNSSRASIVASVEIPFFDFVSATTYNANDSVASNSSRASIVASVEIPFYSYAGGIIL